jgi:outer membrane immunogenic protein
MNRLALSLVAAAALGVGATQFALAADIPVKAPVYTPAPAVVPYNWTGFYLGGHVGLGWGDKTWTNPLVPLSITWDVDGWLAGGQLGFDYQMGSIVIGVGGDFSWSDINGTTTNPLCAGPGAACRTDINWIVMLTGRLGYTWGPGLLYVKGGAAWADEDHRAYVIATNATIATASHTIGGWTVGVGGEWMFNPNWSAKVEYNYIDLGSDTVTFSNATVLQIDNQLHLVKLGLNYRFGLY